ncbi:hypothetical protein CYMTET_12349 [Cymbomonas tetramitiformis]|uniref:Uncharacterized protein n=1 Tax=Cymbomonas tetramitiformis TaxID=36881 RepID=A0AAE0GKG6_9CHLO|nr:hypothetical protein CYMTET_12349 [Cymbomonas tetramitiformis]
MESDFQAALCTIDLKGERAANDEDHACQDVQQRVHSFMTAAKDLELYFNEMKTKSKSSHNDSLRKEISALEAEIKIKDELLATRTKDIAQWQKNLEEAKALHEDQI